MSEKPLRKTQARVAERERTRAQQQRRSAMTKVVPLILGAIAVLFLAFVAYSTAKNADQVVQGTLGARLQVDREQVDLGHRVFNETVRAVFNVKNVGDGTLTLTAPRIAAVLTGC
jgi:hypothetical protein